MKNPGSEDVMAMRHLAIGVACLVGWLCVVPVVGGAADQAPPTPTAPAGTLRIYLARHGQTDWNVEGRMQGGVDTPLNATGRQQAAALKEHLTNVRFDAIYSSALSRSRETADIVRGELAVSAVAGLNERRFGKFEGLLQNSPETGAEFLRRRWDPADALDGGESLNAFTDRVRGALGTIRTRHSSGAILIVGHGGTNQEILQILFSLSLAQTRGIAQVNDELYLIELEAAGGPRLWKLITSANLTDL